MLRPATVLLLGAFLATAHAESEPAYEVHCPDGATSGTECQVDGSTLVGYRTYRSVCLHCHGRASGLHDRMKRLDFDSFRHVVLNGTAGMPGFAGNPRVSSEVDSLYRYLRASADGVLPEGRPKPMDA